jgi:hypothetical protein
VLSQLQIYLHFRKSLFHTSFELWRGTADRVLARDRERFGPSKRMNGRGPSIGTNSIDTWFVASLKAKGRDDANVRATGSELEKEGKAGLSFPFSISSSTSTNATTCTRLCLFVGVSSFSCGANFLRREFSLAPRRLEQVKSIRPPPTFRDRVYRHSTTQRCADKL